MHLVTWLLLFNPKNRPNVDQIKEHLFLNMEKRKANMAKSPVEKTHKKKKAHQISASKTEVVSGSDIDDMV